MYCFFSMLLHLKIYTRHSDLGFQFLFKNICDTVLRKAEIQENFCLISNTHLKLLDLKS